MNTLISTIHFQLHNYMTHLSNVLKLSRSFDIQWKYKINKFYFGTNTKSTNLRIHELVIFNQTTKIDTHEEKYFHSNYITVEGVHIMMFNTTFNNICFIMVVSFIGGGNLKLRKPLICHKSLTNFITQICIENISTWVGFELTTLVVIGTDCTGSCISNNHTIATMTAPMSKECVYHMITTMTVLILQ